MPKLPGFDPIDYLVHRKHPKAISLIGARLNIGDADVPTYQEVLRHQKAADAFRNELSSRTPRQIDKLVRSEKAKERDETVARLAREEERLRYTLFSTRADFDFYCKAAYWTLDECVALSFGMDPRRVNWKTVQPHTGISRLAFRYEKLRELTKRAEWAGQLFDPVRPSIYLAWAKQQKIELADELVSRTVSTGLPLKNWSYLFEQQKAQSKIQVEEQNKKVEELKEALREARTEIEALRKQQTANRANLQARDSNKLLSTKERESLLTLIASMSVSQYDFDPRQLRNAETKYIWEDLQSLGLSMDEDTVRKYLKQGAELIPGDTLNNLNQKPNSGKR